MVKTPRSAGAAIRAMSREVQRTDKRVEKAAALPGLKERLGQLVDLYDTQISAAKKIGRAPETLQNWEKGSMPSFGDVAILAIEKGIRLEWVATGHGAMRASVASEENDEFTFIPRYEVRAGAGIGQLVASEEQSGALAFRTEWIRNRLRRNPTKLAVIEAAGDSMQPTISDGDIMLVDVSETTVRGSAIYIIMAGDEALVKRVEVKLDGSLLVKSDNKEYEPTVFTRDRISELRIAGKVVWTGGMI